MYINLRLWTGDQYRCATFDPEGVNQPATFGRAGPHQSVPFRIVGQNRDFRSKVVYQSATFGPAGLYQSSALGSAGLLKIKVRFLFTLAEGRLTPVRNEAKFPVSVHLKKQLFYHFGILGNSRLLSF